MSGPNINSVFYAESYHPIQAGSIDGTDILPHDNAVYRAHLCSSAGLYEPLGDPNLAGDPYCTVFVSRLSHLTTEDTLRKAMSKYGRVKNLRLVRHIVTGASRGYAFVEFESEREMRRAYKDAHHSMIDDYEIIVDYNRQQLMPGWIPRRLGGGLGGKKESGQLRFGGRERPFRAPLRAIPFDDLKRLGIPAPPEGRYMSRFEVPSPPRRSSVERGERHVRKRYIEMEENSRGKSSMERGDRSSMDREERRHRKRSREREEHHHRRRSRNKEELSRDRSNRDEEESSHKNDRDEHHHKRSSRDKEENSRKRRSRDEEESSHKDREEHHHKVSSRDKEENSRKRRSRDEEEYSRKRNGEEHPYQRQRHGSKSHQHEKSSGQDLNIMFTD